MTNRSSRLAWEVLAFCKCDSYIEGNRYIPAGTVWARPDGVAFSEDDRPVEGLVGTGRSAAGVRTATDCRVCASSFRDREGVGGDYMTIKERKQRILDKIARMQTEGRSPA